MGTQIIEVTAEGSGEVKIPVTHEAAEEPDPSLVRGNCPDCGQKLVSQLYYVGNRGYLLVWCCWGAMQENPTCNYRKVI